SARIPVETLRDIVDIQGLENIDYLKIDVEGYEDQVLYPFFTGSPRALWPKQILMEAKINDAWQRNILSDLTSFGYSVQHTSEDNVWMVLSEQ
ncbi:MAG: FkbM family methyltransferase, partial [Pseudomonadota bacterium]